MNRLLKLSIFKTLGSMFYNDINYFRYVYEAKRLLRSINDPLNIIEIIETIKSTKIFVSNQKNSEILQLLILLSKMQPKNILEIGTEKGGTFFLLCQICNDNGKIISMDFNYPNKAFMKSLYSFSNKGKKIYIIESDSHSESSYDIVKSILQNDLLDFIFIDGDHSYEGVKKDFFTYNNFVRPGGIIALHDINPDSYLKHRIKTKKNVGQVPIFWQELKSIFPNHYEIIDDVEQDGYGIGYLYKE